MQKIRRLYCIGSGAPDVSGTEWRPAALRTVERTDPFSGNIIATTIWTHAQQSNDRSIAHVFAFVDLRTNVGWRTVANMLVTPSDAVHEGILFELWALVVGEASAKSAWAPTWISIDDRAQLIRFPQPVVEWLSDPVPESIMKLVEKWIELPYLRSIAGPKAPEVGTLIVRLMQPIAKIALDRDGTIFAELSDYVIP